MIRKSAGNCYRIGAIQLSDAEGKINRRELAKKVFSDDVQRKKLEGILHPWVNTSASNYEIGGRPREVPRPLFGIPRC